MHPALAIPPPSTFATDARYPTGAFITVQRNLQAVVTLLRARSILKRGTNVTPFAPERLQGSCRAQWETATHANADGSTSDTLAAVHVDNAYVNSSDVGGELVPSLCVAYIDGLRVYSPACVDSWPEDVVSDTLDVQPHGNTETAAEGAVVSAPRRIHNQLPVELNRLLRIKRAVQRHTSTATHVSSSLPHNTARFSFSELFAGIGMFRVALERLGGVSIFASEIAASARAVYQHNFEYNKSITCDCELLGDITAIPSDVLPAHDILTAGFPCQSFAKAGDAQGLRDRRGWLFYEVVRVVRETKPSAFLLENVEHLVNVDGGEQLECVLRELRMAACADGYAVSFRVLDGALVTPQRRKRVYFVGVRRDIGVSEERIAGMLASVEAKLTESSTTSAKSLEDVLDGKVPSSAEESVTQSIDDLQLTPAQWEAVQRSSTYRRNPSWRIADTQSVARTLMGSYRTSFQLYSEFIPLDASKLGPEPRGPPYRFYSIAECERLQGIPDGFQFPVRLENNTKGSSKRIREDESNDLSSAATHSPSGSSRCTIPVGAAYKLIGNAVNPLMVEHIARGLLQLLQTATPWKPIGIVKD